MLSCLFCFHHSFTTRILKSIMQLEFDLSYLQGFIEGEAPDKDVVIQQAS